MLRYDVVDVFTDVPYAGNPLAVVRDSDGLSAAQLQAIAREFNLSETAFPSEPTDAERAAGAHYRVRIFTPGAELPFAGHPSIGTAWALHRDELVPTGAVGQLCGVGVVALEVSSGGGPIELSAAPRGLSLAADAVSALAAVGLDPADAIGDLRVAGCGLDFGYLAVRGDALERATASIRALSGVPARDGGDPLGGLCVYRVEAIGQPVSVTARVFCPDVGVLEDPATGSAALGLGIVLAADKVLAAGARENYVVRQGAQVGRPSTLFGRVTFDAGRVVMCHVGGGVVPVATGSLAPPPA